MSTVSQLFKNLPSQAEFILRSRTIVSREGERAAAIHIRDGVIAAVTDFENIPSSDSVIELGELAVLPGVVDTHVHINEPGRTEWEGFCTATQAAAAGGVTTLMEMPLNSIPATTTVAAYAEKVAAARGKLHVDVGFWGGVVPGNSSELDALWDAGVFGFKCFLVPSGVEQFAQVSEADLRAALAELTATGAPLLVHAELPGPIEGAVERASAGRPSRYATWLASRPREAENEAVGLLVRLAREFGARIHVVHLASSDALAQLRQAKSEGVRISVETCPHYLTFAAEEIPDGATEFKCAPPIRERENREKLWSALRDTTIDFVASDHSPCPPSMKLRERGDFLHSWGGIASLQLALPVIWTEARSRGYALSDVARWMCRGPADLAGLAGKKGAIAAGCDADLVIFDPEKRFHVEPSKLYHRNKLTPYADRELTGAVEATFLRGQLIFESAAVFEMPIGHVLRRGRL
jgi:allantoinase